jgi:hypothetical protein
VIRRFRTLRGPNGDQTGGAECVTLTELGNEPCSHRRMSQGFCHFPAMTAQGCPCLRGVSRLRGEHGPDGRSVPARASVRGRHTLDIEPVCDGPQGPSRVTLCDDAIHD